MSGEQNDFHARIRVLEEHRIEVKESLHLINAKLDSVIVSVSKRSNDCPQPGACLGLKDEVVELRDEHRATMARVDKLETVQAWATGAIAAVSVVWAVVQVFIPFFAK